jgi:hypothetical protein
MLILMYYLFQDLELYLAEQLGGNGDTLRAQALLPQLQRIQLKRLIAIGLGQPANFFLENLVPGFLLL